MAIDLDWDGHAFTAYITLEPGETVGDAEDNALARQMRCEVDDLHWAGPAEALTEPDQTHTTDEYDRWQEALADGLVLWRVRGWRAAC